MELIHASTSKKENVKDISGIIDLVDCVYYSVQLATPKK